MSGGHSYGELAALSAAGAFEPATLLGLSEKRAAAILSAAGDDPGTMAAVSATADEVAAALAGHEVTLANLDAPSQVVISGTTPAVAAALEVLKDKGLSGPPLADRLRLPQPGRGGRERPLREEARPHERGRAASARLVQP
jgi:acyl transferase domain-containing protein